MWTTVDFYDDMGLTGKVESIRVMRVRNHCYYEARHPSGDKEPNLPLRERVIQVRRIDGGLDGVGVEAEQGDLVEGGREGEERGARGAKLGEG